MNTLRRQTMKSLAGLGLLGVVPGWIASAFAREWNKPAFDARNMAESLQSIGADALIESDEISLNAPEIAENGAVVPVEISSAIPGTESIYIFAEKNAQPLTASFDFSGGSDPFIETRIKMAETATLRIVVKAAGKHYTTAKEVKVTIGGCGG